MQIYHPITNPEPCVLGECRITALLEAPCRSYKLLYTGVQYRCNAICIAIHCWCTPSVQQPVSCGCSQISNMYGAVVYYLVEEAAEAAALYEMVL